MSEEERNHRLMELFAEGVELDADGRRSLAERVSQEDPELGAELGALLQVEARGLGDFLEGAAVGLPADLAPAIDEAFREAPRPPQIEGFEEFDLVGEGGMGVVYRAEQRQPVRRTVAIKVIRSGMDSRTVLKRFEVERQALARMSHAYIASVHDAGSDQEGRPFLVMEFVDGSSVTEFCRAEKLSLDERVELCAKICEAVEHAHRRGVLHRDLKPSNVLVIRQDGVAIPKIIDFGIAKSILGDLSEQTLLTQQGAFLGTPEYMGPEQFDLDASKIDTRTDVYALGVIAYEMVTGVLPFDSERLRTSGLGRMVSILQTEVPPKPSTRLRALTKSNGKGAAEAPSFASPTRWAQRIKGELDWVVMKALAKDPDHRYGTPGAMADDLRRFLSFEPVMAAPPSGAFRFRRFVRRYRIQVTAGLLLFLSLIAGLTGTLWFLAESKDNEAIANRRASEAVEAQRMEAGSGLAARAALVTEGDPNLALLLGLEAGGLADEYVAADAIYRALPGHDLLGSLNLRDKPTRQFEFLADGSLLAMTVDNVIWRIDHDRGAVIQRFDGHTDRIEDMDVAPEIGLVLTGARDQTVRLWDIDDGACRAVLEQGGSIRSVAFSPERRWFAALSEDGVVRVYDLESVALTHEFEARDAGRSSIDFSPTEATLLLHDVDGGGEIRSLEDGKLVRRIPPPTSKSHAGLSTARFSPKGDRIIREYGRLTAAYRVQVMTLAGTVIADLYDCRLMRGPLSETHMALLNGQIVYLSLESGEIVGRLDSEPLSSLLGIDLDGKRFVAVDKQLDIGLFDLRTGSKLRSIAGSQEKLWIEARVAFHPDGRRFAVTGPRARIWSLTPEYEPLQMLKGVEKFGYEERGTLACGTRGALGLAHEVEPDGSSSWTLWNIDERRVLRKLQPPGVDLLYLSADAEKLLGREDHRVEDGKAEEYVFVVFDLEGRRLGERRAPKAGSRHWIHPNGSMIATRFATTDDRETFQMMDFTTGEVLWEREQYTAYFLFDDGPGLGYATSHTVRNGLTKIFDAATGTVQRSIQSPRGIAFDGAFDPEKRRALLTHSHKIVRAYDVDRASDEATGEYTRLVYSDRRRAGLIPQTDLAWAQCSNEVHIFHAVSCRPFAVLPLDSVVYGIVARPDGSEILTLTQSGQCQRWPTNPMAVAERVVVEGLNASMLKQYGIGTPEERRARDHERLLAAPSPNGMARIGEAALADGDLDLAISYFRRVVEFGPLGREGGTQYRRRLELLCRRISRSETSEKVRAADIKEALGVLGDCLSNGVPLETLRTYSGFDRLEADPAASAMLGN